METYKALVIKKSDYGEADLIVTFYTKEIGKIKALARQAKKSKKRFGGRLELFNELEVEITINENKFNIINEIKIKKAYSKILENMETFLVSAFILEHLQILTIENEPNEQLYNHVISAFKLMERNENILPNLLKFQLSVLKVSGYEPNLENVNDSEYSYIDIQRGIVENSLKTDNKNIFKFYTDIIKTPEYMDIFLGKVANNIKILTKYIEHHSGKNFKTSQFLEDLNL